MEEENNKNTKVLVTMIVLLAALLAAFGTWAYLAYVAPDQEEVVQDELDIQTEDEVSVSDETSRANIASPAGLDYSEDELVYDGNAPVYVTLYSHNEDSWEYKVNSPDKYYSYREDLIHRSEVIAEYGIEWNWQTDQPVVEAMVEYEFDPGFKATYELSGDANKNVLEYLETLGVHFDPHAHTNNYADIAFIMEEFLGVDATPVIGGLTHVECGRELYGFLDYMSWHEQIDLQPDGYVYGEDYSEAKWKPEILSDPGMGGHYFDDYSIGVWKPGNEDSFYNHYPNNDIVYIGEGYPHDTTVIGTHHASGATVWAEDGAYIKELVEKIESSELPTGLVTGEKFMYTVSVHMRDTETVTEGGGEPVNTADGISDFLDELAPLRDAGKIVYVDFEEAARIWQDEFNALPYFVSLESFSFYNELRSEAGDFCEARLELETKRPQR